MPISRESTSASTSSRGSAKVFNFFCFAFCQRYSANGCRCWAETISLSTLPSSVANTAHCAFARAIASKRRFLFLMRDACLGLTTVTNPVDPRAHRVLHGHLYPELRDRVNRAGTGGASVMPTTWGLRDAGTRIHSIAWGFEFSAPRKDFQMATSAPEEGINKTYEPPFSSSPGARMVILFVPLSQQIQNPLSFSFAYSPYNTHGDSVTTSVNISPRRATSDSDCATLLRPSNLQWGGSGSTKQVTFHSPTNDASLGGGIAYRWFELSQRRRRGNRLHPSRRSSPGHPDANYI